MMVVKAWSWYFVELLSRSFWPTHIIVPHISYHDLPCHSIISHCLWVHPKKTKSKKDVGSPKSTSLLSTFHIGTMFCFSPANFMSSTYTDKNNPFSRWMNKHWKLSPNCISIRCSQIAVPTVSLAKGWPYRFRSRGTTGSSILDHATWTFMPFVLASSITSDLFLTFVVSHAGVFSSFSHSLSTAAFVAGIFIAWGMGINLCTRL